jgi:acetyl-CoA carboxylase carboxyl transferase subunit beta
MSWLHRAKKGVRIQRTAEKKELPEGMWTKCPGCSDIVYRVELDKNLWVCTRCSYHFPLNARQYVDVLTDAGTFDETFRNITSLDPLNFRDAKEKYRLKLKKTMLRTNLTEAVLTGRARLHGRPIVLGVFDFSFLGGSMGSAVGEKIARAGLDALERHAPLIVLSRSGGARMHESVLSLMQMAKTSAVLAKMHEARVPFISIMSDPTTGGVSASFASLGDVILAEPQTAEFVQECGFVDLIVSRGEMRSVLHRLLCFLCGSEQEEKTLEPEVEEPPVPEEEPTRDPDTTPSPSDVLGTPHETKREIGLHGPA